MATITGPSGFGSAPPESPDQQAFGARVGSLRTGYDALVRSRNVPYLSYNDPQLVAEYADKLGVDQATALNMSRASADWHKQNPGQVINPEQQTALLWGMYQQRPGAQAAAAPAQPAQPAPAPASGAPSYQPAQPAASPWTGGGWGGGYPPGYGPGNTSPEWSGYFQGRSGYPGQSGFYGPGYYNPYAGTYSQWNTPAARDYGGLNLGMGFAGGYPPWASGGRVAALPGGEAQAPVRAWGQTRPGEMYVQVEGPGNPSWEARHPEMDPRAGFELQGSAGYVDRLRQMVQAQYGAQGGSAGGGYPMGSAFTPSQDISAYAAALPAPNQIVARNWVNLPSSSRDFLLGTYEQMGYDPNDVLETIQRTSTPWQGPWAGAVRR
ncbi:MAG TPA: hypothetical protein VKG45_00610 [Actinomycetes bacterium]|nr:hypothetical protein [Actinomycetes bacterium]